MRKLNKKEVIIVSRILEDVNFKYYVEYLMGNRVDKILKSSGDMKVKILAVTADITAFVLQNLNKADENIDLLIMSYKGISLEDIQKLDIDEYVDCLKEIFIAGVPKILSSYVNLAEVKKKVTELREEMQS